MSTRKGKYGDPRKRKPVAGDLARYVQPTGLANPRRLGGQMVGPGGPRDRGAVFLDLTDCVLMDAVEVCTVEQVRQGALAGQAIFMTLGGRINKRPDQVQVGFVFGPDGAASLITQLLALADRHGAELLDDMTRRLTELHQERAVDLAFLRAAVDNAIEAAGEVAAELTPQGLAGAPATSPRGPCPCTAPQEDPQTRTAPTGALCICGHPVGLHDSGGRCQIPTEVLF